ncbi:MAG: sodium-dependent transporter [Gemmatimonadetes bacterium]|nr:sodium-dependent transporter [Gemmatimonadota bacterium]
MTKHESFSSRWIMMLTMLGMAVGTGNIWRFPRIVAEHGGGAFLVSWVIFLLLWSIPLILVEFGTGRMTRTGPVGAFMRLMGPRYAWMGAWVAFVAVAIMFYYSVVTGWTLRYAVAAAAGEVPGTSPLAFWTAYTSGWGPVLTHGIAMFLGAFVVIRGVGAIEKMSKIMMPTLIILVVILTIRAVTLPGAGAGLSYMFSVNPADLAKADTWLQALTQNAWDTGAGWGLILVYAAYMRQDEDTTLNAFILPTANNSVSLCAGMMVLCTVFSVLPGLVESFATNPAALADYPALAQAIQSGQALTPDLVRKTIFTAGNEGLTFNWMPLLFAKLPLGRLLMVLFFVALAFAAFTSLVAMIELGSRVLRDMGVSRERAVIAVGTAGFLLGVPSALSINVLHNQDWVWGVALMVSGLFFAIAVLHHGVTRFRSEQLNHEGSDIHIGRWWEVVIGVVVPLEALVLLGWWLYQARGWDPEGWLDPLGVENVGTILLQWGVVLVALLLANRMLAARTRPVPPTRDDHMPAAVP